MIDLRAFGGLDVRAEGGAPLDDLLRQPKRAALLAWLALADPTGFHRRDTILLLFWPDLDAAHARAALRKSLHTLRSIVGPEAIVSRGDDEVGIDWQYLRSDVADFSSAVAKGRIAEALALYRGDLLTGFHLNDSSPEWEQWLDGRRAELRRVAAKAAWTHAKTLADAGEVTEGIRWARWACSRTPDDEPAVRQLLTLLGDLGDRAGALYLYEEFRTRLRSEYNAQPAPETQELMRDIRARAESNIPDLPPPDAPQPEPVQARTVVAHGTADAQGAPAPISTTAPIAAPRPARPWRRAMIAVPLVAVAIAAPLLWNGTRAGPIDADLVVIAPFTVLSPALAVWGEGMVDVLTRNLDQAGPLRTVSPSRTMRLWQNDGAGRASSEGLGEDAGAGIVISGTLLALAGDSLRVSATVLDRTAGRPIGDIQVEGAVDRMGIVIDSVTRSVLRIIGTVRQIGSANYPSIGARSVPALKAFLQGEQFRRRSWWDSARTRYEMSIAIDSTFALAWLRLGEVNSMSQYPVQLGGGRVSSDNWKHQVYRAGTVNHGLSRHDSLGVEVFSGLAALETGRIPAANANREVQRVYAAALEATRLYPNDAEAWYWRAVTEDRAGPTPEATYERAYASFRRATALDSGFTPAYRAALSVSGKVGDVEGTFRLAEHYLTLDPAGAARDLAAAIVPLLRPGTQPAARQRLLDSLAPDVAWPLLQILWRLPDAQEVGIRVARARLARGPDARYWFTSLARRDLAAVLAYRGHFREALELAGDERSTWFANLFGELTAFGAVPSSRADSVFGDWLTNHPDTPGLSEAMSWWASTRDTLAIRRQMALRRFGASRVDSAYLALARGDTVQAMAQLQSVKWLGYRSRLLLVQLLSRAGATAAALKILNERAPNDWPLPSHVIWTLLRARLSEQAGDRAAAARDFRFVADVWQHADKELQPYVTEAREAVQRLRGGRPLLRDAPRAGVIALPGRLTGRAAEGP